MTIWKVTDNVPQKVTETTLINEKLLEENLEDWIVADPAILGEPLLVIGRQVMIPDIKERLDLLAIDQQGAAVIIELKRGHLKDPVDFQALRYASYISKWQFEDFESIAKKFLSKNDDSDFNFNEVFESFCEESGTDEAPNLNEEQRIIIVGSAVREKLGSVALWLRDHSVDIKLIEVQAYKEGENLLIEPKVIVPLELSKFKDVGKARREGTPWMTDGKSWHLDKRCSSTTRDIFHKLDTIIQDHLDVDGPGWNQKHYVAYRSNNFNWLCVNTKQKSLWLDFHVKAQTFTADHVARELKIAKFDKEESLSEKLGLPSSVLVKNIRENIDRVRIRVKDDFDVESDVFLRFVENAYKACPK